MPVGPNKTLKDVIADRLCERSVEACWRLFRQTLEAVAYLHSKDIVHRDLKPANIFIGHKQADMSTPFPRLQSKPSTAADRFLFSSHLALLVSVVRVEQTTSNP